MEKTRDTILQAIEEGKKVSLTKGRAVQIGRLWSSPLAETLMQVYPHLIDEGYSLEELSQIVQDTEHEGSRD
jgi:hypothetical protein